MQVVFYNFYAHADQQTNKRQLLATFLRIKLIKIYCQILFDLSSPSCLRYLNIFANYDFSLITKSEVGFKGAL